MLSKEVSSTIFKVFGMTRPGIEPKYPGPFANTLPNGGKKKGNGIKKEKEKKRLKKKEEVKKKETKNKKLSLATVVEG